MTTRVTFVDWRGVASASRVYAANGYEISDDLKRRQVEVLEKRYGGRHRAHRAAATIQRAFRQYRLNKRWREMTCLKQRTVYSGEVSSSMTVGSAGSYRLVNNNNSSPLCSTSSSRNSGSPSSMTRYLPTTSLSAQLRADRAYRVGSEERSPRTVRTPPSPSPSSAHNKSMIESLMSPRLVQRRFPCTAAEVWIPRATLAQSNAAHSNSLPRLEKTILRDDVEQHVKPLRKFHSEQERKRQYRIALNFFNKKPDRGVQLLTAWGFVDESAECLAKLLFGRRGLSKAMIGEYIGTLHSPFHSCVLKYFIGLIDLRGLEIDVALRKAMQLFILPKEAEKIDKIIQAFAIHYSKCNPKRTAYFRGGWDTVHLLSFAVILLNTDLHTPSLKASQRMKREDFVRNLRGQDKTAGEKEGRDIDRSILEGIYERVRVDEFKPGDDHVAQVARVDNAIVGKEKPRLTENHRRLVCYCRLQQVDDPNRRFGSNVHERDVFLFNDMLIVTKVMNKRRSNAATSYTLKHWTPLLGSSIQEFHTPNYECGMTVTCADGQRLYFNAKNFEDRRRFRADVEESMAESREMEDVRLELEMERHTMRTDAQRDSGLPEMDDPRGHVTLNGSANGRRLSFNSLDSGMVEESCETSA